MQLVSTLIFLPSNLFTATLLTLFITNQTAFAQEKQEQTAKITMVERTTDASGKTVEKVVEKTGKEAEDYLNAHPEIKNAANGEFITRKVTIARKYINAMTGQLVTETVVKEGKEAQAIDLAKLYKEGGASLEKSIFSDLTPPTGQQSVKVEQRQKTTKENNIENSSEDVNITIDQTQDAENRAYLGVAAADLPSPLGVVVDFVLEDSPAAAVGLREWDIISAVQGVPVRSAIELQKALAPFGPSDKINIDLFRNQLPMKVVVTLQSSDPVGREVPKARPKKTEPIPTPKEADLPTLPQDTDMPFKNFKVYPNPSGSGIFTLQMDLTQKDFLLIKIIDPIRESEVLSQTVANRNGEYTLQADLQKQKSGNYTLSITHNGSTYTKTLTIQK
jgi:PDZ domain